MTTPPLAVAILGGSLAVVLSFVDVQEERVLTLEEILVGRKFAGLPWLYALPAGCQYAPFSSSIIITRSNSPTPVTSSRWRRHIKRKSKEFNDLLGPIVNRPLREPSPIAHFIHGTEIVGNKSQQLYWIKFNPDHRSSILGNDRERGQFLTS